MTAIVPPWIKIRRVEVGGMSITIELDEELETFGNWNIDKQVIWVGPKAEMDFWGTLRHEMRHAALEIGGVAYNERMEVEAVVRCLDYLFDPAWDALQPMRPPTI